MLMPLLVDGMILQLIKIHMSKNQQTDREPHLEDHLVEAIKKRREALQKLGRFSLYATPVVLGVIGSTPAHASANLFEA